MFFSWRSLYEVGYTALICPMCRSSNCLQQHPERSGTPRADTRASPQQLQLGPQNGLPSAANLLAHHVLHSLLDLREGDGLSTVEEHPSNGVHAAEHLRQNLELVGQREPRRQVLREGVEPLVRRGLLTAGKGER